MPAVLIEMGYLTNPTQEKRWPAANSRTAIAQAILDAIVRFRELAGRLERPAR